MNPEVARATLVEAAHAKGLAPTTDAMWQELAPLACLDAWHARLVRRPRFAQWLGNRRNQGDLMADGAPLRRRLAVTRDPARFDSRLRRVRHGVMCDLALADLHRRLPLREIIARLSALADGLLDAALQHHAGSLAGEICILAMGKLGGRELNYSSDVDVIFLVTDETAATRRREAEVVARKVVASLSTMTADGFAFRVDTNLRPFGKAGPLVCGVGEAEDYYETVGRTWERAALIKARPCAGNLALGTELLHRVEPFVWRRSRDLATVEAVAAMKRRIDDARAGTDDDNVKLGAGGIREIEFFAQAYQLLHGGLKPALRIPATLDALDAIAAAGLIAQNDRDVLVDAYTFLRDVEHRLQLPGDRQTQSLPADHRPVAALMGFPDAATFDAALRRHRVAVHKMFVELLAGASEAPRVDPDAAVAVDEDLPDVLREAALQRMGFDAPHEAVLELRRLARRLDGPFGSLAKDRHATLPVRLIRALAGTSWPDAALSRLAWLEPPRWHQASLSSLLDANPATMRGLATLLAATESMARAFSLRPELLDTLLTPEGSPLSRSRIELDAAVQQRIDESPELEDKLGALRRFRLDETLRIALHDLGGRLDVDEVAAQLTTLAEALLAASLSLAQAVVRAQTGQAPGVTVVGFGSLGAREMSYESDLDLVFVHDGEAPEAAARVCQKLLSFLTIPTADGILYDVDARLRPSGQQGMLVTSLGGFAAYHSDAARGAHVWERQALLRARVVAGPPSLCSAAEAIITEAIERPADPETLPLVAAMRHRLDLPPTEHAVDPKRAPGGRLDVEFLVLGLLLLTGRHAGNTGDALGIAVEEGLLRPGDAASLRAAHTFFRRIESRLRLIFGRRDVFLPTTGRRLTALARQLGFDGDDAGKKLHAELSRVLSQTRRMFDRVIR